MNHIDIHKTICSRGSVTLIERFFTEDTEHAHVFLPKGTDWVDAKPRQATEEEVSLITKNALKVWRPAS